MGLICASNAGLLRFSKAEKGVTNVTPHISRKSFTLSEVVMQPHLGNVHHDFFIAVVGDG